MLIARGCAHVRDGARGLLLPGGLRAPVDPRPAIGGRSVPADLAQINRPPLGEPSPRLSRGGGPGSRAAGVRGAALARCSRPGYLRRRAIPEETARIQRLGYADGHTLL